MFSPVKKAYDWTDPEIIHLNIILPEYFNIEISHYEKKYMSKHFNL
jgi:hypothetical protein